MLKKMMLLALAVGALIAFAAPAAMANVTVTNTAGEPAHNITAFSSNLTTTTTAGTLFCNETDLTATVDNGADATLTDITGTAKFNTSTECPVLNGSGEPVTGAIITNIEGGATLEASGHGEAAFAFEYDLTVAPGVSITCEFHTEGATITYTTGPPAVISISKAALTGTGANCPTTGTLNGSLSYDGTIDD